MLQQKRKIYAWLGFAAVWAAIFFVLLHPSHKRVAPHDTLSVRSSAMQKSMETKPAAAPENGK